jgi:REP element-mobilizing transposase RayT
MPDTYSHIRYHFIFATKNRAPLINADIRDELYSYLSAILSRQHATPIAMGGMPDHVHLLVGLRTVHVLPDLMRELKANSSKWMKGRQGERFAWQVGYGAFSVSASVTATVRNYILKQEEHHSRFSFQEELNRILQKHGFEPDSAFLGG